MGPSSEPPRTLAFASMHCDVRKGAWEPYVLSVEADSVVVTCPEKSENQVSCKNPLREEFIADVGGLEFSPSLSQEKIPTLPKFIPILEKSFVWSAPALIPSDFIGISVADIFVSSLRQVGGRWRAPSLHLNPRLKQSPLFSEKKVILFMSGQDVLIETLWMEQNKLSFFESLREAGFQLATSPNFSVFAGECPLGHRINQKKSLVCARLLEVAGIKAIPHVYAITPTHLRKYIEYFKAYPSVRTITINCTLQRKEHDEVQSVVRRVAGLLDEISDLHIILQGLNARDRRFFCEYDSQLHYAVSTPFYNALLRKQSIFNTQRKRMDVKLRSPSSKDELVRGNVQAYVDYFNETCI